MKIIPGTALNGRIVVEREKYTARQETFHVSAREKRELLDSIAQAKRGEFVDADALLMELDELLEP